MNWSRRTVGLNRNRDRREHEAARQERERLARDLHDGLSQDLYATHLALSALVDQLPERFRSPVEQLIDRQVIMIRSLRETLHRPPDDNETVTTLDLITHLDQIARRELGEALRVKTTPTTPHTISAGVAHHARCALREMLSNALRHSSATNVSVVAELDARRIMIQVDDDGHGLDHPVQLGNGLRNLQIRAQRCGGWFRLAARRPRGVRAQWTAHLQSAPRDEAAISARNDAGPTPTPSA